MNSLNILKSSSICRTDNTRGGLFCMFMYKHQPNTYALFAVNDGR